MPPRIRMGPGPFVNSEVLWIASAWITSAWELAVNIGIVTEYP